MHVSITCYVETGHQQLFFLISTWPGSPLSTVIVVLEALPLTAVGSPAAMVSASCVTCGVNYLVF